MKRRIYGMLGAAAIAAFGAACKEDPLADTGGSLRRLDLEYAYREVVVADSVRTFAIERDALNTPLSPTATVRSCNTAIATVSPVSDAPQQRTGFYVKGVTYGATCVIAEAGALADTMQVATFPASIVVLSGPDSVVSGTSGSYTYEFRDAKGAVVTGVPVATWAGSDTLRGIVTTGGVLTGRDSGLVTVTVTGIGSPSAGLSAQKGVLVIPAPFTGTVTPNPADPGQTAKIARDPTAPIFDANTTLSFSGARQTFVAGSLTPDSVKVAIPDVAAGGALGVAMAGLGPAQITQSGGLFTVNTPALLAGTITPSSGAPAELVTVRRAGGDPAFDANTRVYFAGVRTIINVNTPDSLIVAVPGIGSAGAKELRMTRIDATDVARRVTFAADTGVFAFADPFDDVNDDPTTAPVISANGDYFVVVSGACVDGVGGASSDCDDFFTITNSTGAPLAVTVRLDWMNASDVDILWCNAACTAFVGNFNGATGANPESSTVSIPAGTTWRLWINLFDPHGAPSDVVRVRVSGLP